MGLPIIIVAHLLLILCAMMIIVEGNDVRINCGGSLNIVVDGRTWFPDSSYPMNVTLSAPGIEEVSAATDNSSYYGEVHKTARVFPTVSNYTIRVVPGIVLLRLHFSPFPFQGYAADKKALFVVMANNLILLSSFNVVDEIDSKNLYLQNVGSSLNFSSLIKEYYLTVDSPELVIAFIPLQTSFAYVNAIEVIPVSNEIFQPSVFRVGSGAGVRDQALNVNALKLETMYRLNVGGPEILPAGDSDLMRTWETDSDYMFSANAADLIENTSSIAYSNINESIVAPLVVYETARIMANNEVFLRRFNMSWRFPVDPDFDYLVRLHFCELIYDAARRRVFRIYINNRTASNYFDVFTRAGGGNKAYHEDYLDSLPKLANTIWVQLGPDPSIGESVTDAILNGIEIFKLSKDGTFAIQPENFRVSGDGSTGGNSKSRIMWVATGSGIAAFTILSAFTLMFFCVCNRKKGEPTPISAWKPLFLYENTLNNIVDVKCPKTPTNSRGLQSSRHGRRFSISEISAATSNFNESLVIGVGGFGKVYRGVIEDGVSVAIKRANIHSEQGMAEFEAEVDILSKIRHRHLVSIIGFCDEQNEMILVYEYMGNGSLRDHLYGTDLPVVSWKRRLEICIGAARGLHYLHTGLERGIIHRDVKSTNILLDENFVAKVADFGLSRTGPSLDHTHVSTAVKGSFGYLDPEYFRRQQLTEKSDVYSFGVLLFEVLCSRPVINPSLPKEQINLAEWGIHRQHVGLLHDIVDPRLKEQISSVSLKKFGEIVEKCLADEGKRRPTIGEVLWHLECVLRLEQVEPLPQDSDLF